MMIGIPVVFVQGVRVKERIKVDRVDPDIAEVIGPGTASTGRPRSRAYRALFSAPERRAASTTSVALPNAAINRLRLRNRWRCGALPGGRSLTSTPTSAVRAYSRSCPAG